MKENRSDIPMLLSPNGGGRTIDEAVADARTVIEAAGRADAQTDCGQILLGNGSLRMVMFRLTLPTGTFTASIEFSTDVEWDADETAALPQALRMLRDVSEAPIDRADAHASTRTEAIEALLASPLADLVRERVIVRLSRPTPLNAQRGSVVLMEDGGSFMEFDVEHPLPPGQTSLTATPHTDRDSRGLPIMNVNVSERTQAHRLDGLDSMAVLRELGSR